MSPSNSPRKAGMVVSVLGFICCVSALLLIVLMGASKTPIQSSEPDHYLVKGAQVVSDGMTFLGQLILFLVGVLVGGTLSLVGLGLSVAEIRRHPNRFAKIGIIAGIAGPALLAIFVLTL